MKRDNDGYLLSTGRHIYANVGYIGINDKLEVSEGYDSTVRLFDKAEEWDHHEQLTPEEQVEVCDYMIELWAKRKALRSV